jgi:hypothetical protein
MLRKYCWENIEIKGEIRHKRLIDLLNMKIHNLHSSSSSSITIIIIIITIMNSRMLCAGDQIYMQSFRQNICTSITILDIIHCPVFYLKTLRFRDWIVSPMSDGTYSAKIFMNNVLNCDSYINVPSTQICRSYCWACRFGEVAIDLMTQSKLVLYICGRSLWTGYCSSQFTDSYHSSQWQKSVNCELGIAGYVSICLQLYCMLVFTVFHYVFRPTWPSSRNITCNTHWTIQCSRMLKYSIMNISLWTGLFGPGWGPVGVSCNVSGTHFC